MSYNSLQPGRILILMKDCPIDVFHGCLLSLLKRYTHSLSLSLSLSHQESNRGEGDVNVDGLESVPRGDEEGGGEGGGREVREEVSHHQLQTLEPTPHQSLTATQTHNTSLSLFLSE